MRLCIISHTEHFTDSNGQIVGWGPTINEINYLTEIFDEIYHLAMLYKGNAPKSALPYTTDKIKFVPLPTLGGKTLGSKVKLLFKAPKVIRIVSETLQKVDCFQLRTPTGIGVYLIPYLTVFTNKKGWFKYAGNWNQKKPPSGYAIQRFMLKRQNRIVTINGQWPNQPKHCLTFENPCLTLSDLEDGKIVTKNKDYSKPLVFCFVGRLERDKGVERIIKAFSFLDHSYRNKVETVHFVGEGLEVEYFKSLALESGVNMLFHGALPRDSVFKIYKQSHVLLLPSSASEGFPKVIAEAINFGCIPVVSDISSISHYVKHGENGYIIRPNTPQNLTRLIVAIIDSNQNIDVLSHKNNFAHLFSFKTYNNKIKRIIKN